ncbi:MAG TPA: helix-turn-helix domain-containing protein, partial [Micromonospora sp.]
MAERTTVSSVPRRHLGRKLRELRVGARMTLEGAAAALSCAAQRLWLVESGLGPIRTADVGAMCELYEAGPEPTAALVALAGETKARGWWHAYDSPVPAWLDLYPGLE